MSDDINEVLNLQQRMKKRQIAKRIKGKLKIGRKKAKFKMADQKKLKNRAQKQARQIMRGKLAGTIGKDYKKLGFSQRSQVDKKLVTKKSVISRLAKRLLPKVRKAEMKRLSQARQARREDYDIMNAVYGFYETEYKKVITEKIEKNLRKKSEKYNVSYESLIDKYFEYRNTKSTENAFDKLNNYLVSEDDKPNKRGDDAKGHKRPTEDGAGLTRAGAKAAGVKTAVTTPPSKLDPDGKAAKRRKSFCARMGGMKGPMKDEKGRPTRKAMSLKRWNC
jgi:hypothetical protein